MTFWGGKLTKKIPFYTACSMNFKICIVGLPNQLLIQISSEYSKCWKFQYEYITSIGANSGSVRPLWLHFFELKSKFRYIRLECDKMTSSRKMFKIKRRIF